MHRDFKQIATTTCITVVVDTESWGEYLTIAQQISSLSKGQPNSDYWVYCSFAFTVSKKRKT